MKASYSYTDSEKNMRTLPDKPGGAAWLHCRKSRQGQALLLVTFAMIPMFAMLGLVTDVGYMQYLKGSAQSAADAAALAAVYRYNRTVYGSAMDCSASSWMCHETPWPCPAAIEHATNPAEAACLYAKKNGFSTANSRQSVTIVSGVSSAIPTSTAVNNGGWWITVRVTQTVPQLFSAVMGKTSGLVAARATTSVQPSLACVYALDPAAAQSYYQNGNTNFLSACGIYVNSSASPAMQGVGGAIVSAPFINVVGGVDWQGTMTPTASTGATSVADPLAAMPPPSQCSSTGGCAPAGCSTHAKALVINSDTTLSPGVYCAGIKVKNATVTFSAGTYILVGGGLSTQDSNSHVRGSGVLFYNSYDSANSYSPIDFNANSDVQISAATSGSNAGILYAQDRTCCDTAIPTDSFQGGADSYFEGVLYSPRSLVQFAGNASLSIAHYTVVVARQFAVQGSSAMNNDYSHLVGGNPIKSVGLVE